MKIALVHDYIKEYGGAERVLEALHELYPSAPVFTSVYLPEYLGPHRERFKDWNIKTTPLQDIPFKAKLISPFRLLTPLAFKIFDFSSYDLIIVSSTGAYLPNSIRKKKAVQICYCHTPPRYLYGYATARTQNSYFIKSLTAIAFHFLRIIDYHTSQNVDFFISNSQEVKARIKKFYRRDATIINPPVDVLLSGRDESQKNDLANSLYGGKREYYLTGGRLARPKHIDVIVQTFTRLNKPLKVFGKSFAGYKDELAKIAGPTIEFLGEISDEEKLVLMQRARAFIFAAEDEDFGITPLEAQSVGTPVIAYKSGGVKETIQEDKTGVFFDTLAVGSLAIAITKFEKLKFKQEDLMRHTKQYSKKEFQKKISSFVKSVVQ